MRLYLDAAPIIYTVERVQPYVTHVDARLALPGVEAVTSDLAWLECRVKPLRDGDAALLQDFAEFFEAAIAEVAPLSRATVDIAASIRARYGFRTPDALHLAAAAALGCDIFITNDRRLDRFAEVRVETVQP